MGATGGRLYADESGPGPSSKLEYATPECDNVFDLARADKGGERALNLLSELLVSKGLTYYGKKIRRIAITKNNSDLIRGRPISRTNFYGSHENYEIDKELHHTSGSGAEGIFLKHLTSLLVLRQLLSGAGGLCRVDGQWSYIISPIALATNIFCGTFTGGPQRPLVSYRINAAECCLSRKVRLHIPAADSNMMMRAVRFRFAAVSAFLDIFETHKEGKYNFPILSSPLESLHAFTRDQTLRSRAHLENRRGQWSMPEALLEWLEVLLRFTEGGDAAASTSDVNVLRKARNLTADSIKSPDALEQETDWGLKLKLIKHLCRKKRLTFSSREARFLDTLYCDISRSGVYNRWEAHRNPQIFSEEDMKTMVWRHQAAPRAELRKRYISALARHDLAFGQHEWGNFLIGDDPMVLITDPMIGHDQRLERYLESLDRV